MENQQRAGRGNQAIMLDLSLFILDLLDTEKIKSRTLVTDHILEVPSSLVLMMRDTRSGSPVLFLFLYSLLNKLIKDQQVKEEKSKDPRIIELLSCSDQKLREKAWGAAKNLSESFSTLIYQKEELASSLDQPSPIKRYDDIQSLSPKEQEELQDIYTREIGLPKHPLYDLYFAQIYHALSTSNQGSSGGWVHKNISITDSSFNVIWQWKKINKLHEEKDRNIISVSRELIKWFTLTYIKDDWKNMIFDTTLSLAVDFIQNGHIGISSITLAAGTIIPKVITQIPPEILSPTERTILFIVFMFFFFICVVIVTRPTWPIKLTHPLTSTPTQLPTPFNTPTSIVVPSPTITITPTSTLLPTWTRTPLPTTTMLPYNPNYCLYLTQAGDTAQSISSWFGISEATYRAENNSYAGTELTAGQIVTISAPCCNAQFPSWHTYEVKQGDRLYSLATSAGISVNELAYANHITNQGYIQTGQMLCVPPQ